jgi:hypothetical protein
MALVPTQQAANVEFILNAAFPDGIRESELSMVFSKFEELCQDNNGKPFAMLPAFDVVETENSHATVIFHAAWFRGSDGFDAFAAVVFEKSSGKLLITHDFDKNWPQWLDTELRKITNSIVKAEGNKPPQSH